MGETRAPASDLLIRCQRGDRQALGELFSQIGNDVLRTAYLLTGDRTTAEDVTQNVFVRLLLSFHRYDITRPFRPWLYKIVVHEAQAEKKRRQSFWRRNHACYPTVTPGPEQDVLAAERSRAAKAAIASLPEHHRIVIVLRYVGGLHVNEIAQVLECPIGTVKSRLHYAERALRREPTLRQFREGPTNYEL